MGKYFAKTRYFTAAAAAVCAAVALVSAAAPLAVHANSGPDYYYGTDGTVLYPVDDCPLEVEGELLTFDIQKFPQEYSLEGYNSTVTAEYTFFNPTEDDVVVGMLFPFGTLPEYAFGADGATCDDSSLFNVSVDGKAHDFSLRLSYSSTNSFYNFDFDGEKAMLYDAPCENVYGLTPQSAVYIYRIGVEQGDLVTAVYSSFGGAVITDGIIGMGADGKVDDVCFTQDGFIAFAGGLPGEIEFTLRRDVYTENGAIDEGGAGEVCDIEVSEESTFSQLIAQYMPSFLSGVGHTDWFNYIINLIGRGNILHVRNILSDVQYNAMRWLEYTVQVPAGGRITNAVTVPVYPEIHFGTEPETYMYYYYLSPAQGWADFKNLTVRINCPYYYISGNCEGFAPDGTGYLAQFETLPKGELSFMLSTDPNPKNIPNTGYVLAVVLIALAIAVPVLLVAAVVVIFVVAYKRAKGNKGHN